MASGWNLWVWLQCIGVASRCCYKEVYVTVHAKTYHKSAKNFIEIRADFALPIFNLLSL